METKTVLLVCNTDAALYKFRHPIIMELRRRGVRVVTLGGDAGYGPQLSGIVDSHIVIGQYGEGTIISFLKVLSTALAVVRQEQPDVIHGFTHYGNFLGAFCYLISVARKTRPTLLFTVTGMGRAFVADGSRWSRRIIQKMMVLLFYRITSLFARKIFVQNSADMQLLQKNVWRARVGLQPGSGIAVDAQYRRCERTVGEKLFVLMAARTVPEKGVHIYFEAARMYRQLMADGGALEFQFVGGRSLNEPFDEEVADLASKCGVAYHGYVADADGYLARSDVVVLPSYYREGVPRSLLEALLKDRFIITTDTAGCQDTVIDGWNGYLVAPKSANDLLAKFLELNIDVTNKTISRSHRLCGARFDSTLIVSDTLSSYP